MDNSFSRYRRNEMQENGRNSLTGKIALITGAGSGIGAAIAQELAQLGATSVVCGRTRSKLNATAAAISGRGGKADAMECDLKDLQSVEALAAHVEKTYGKLHILVNNAGVGTFGGALHSMPPAEWESVMNTNLRGVFYCIRSFAPLMIKTGGGDIVNISSLAGKNALPNGAAYAASKWGLNGLSYSVAEELRGHNIRVSVVCPGSTNTDLGPHAGKNSSKMLQPDDVAHVVTMLVTQAPQSFASEVLLRPTQKP
jgi:NAD(P)-dependent dehydrogenase (short-subunit alcohol dehydrogenase family)